MPKYRGKDAPCVSNLKFADGSDAPRDPDDPGCIILDAGGESKCYVGVGSNISVATEPNADGNYEISVIDNDVMSTVVFNDDGTGLLTQSDGTKKLVLCGPLTIVADLDPGTDPTVEGSDGGNIIHIPGSTILPGANGTAIIVTSDGEQKEVLCGPIQVVEDLPYGTDPYFLGTDVAGWILHLPQVNHELVNNNDGTGTVTIEGVACTFVKGPLDPLTVVTAPPGTTPSWNGSELTVPTSTVTPNGDGTATVVQANGDQKLVLCGPLNILADLPPGSAPNIDGTDAGNIIHIGGSTVEDQGDGTALMTQSDGTTKTVLCGPISIVADLPSGDDPTADGGPGGWVIHIPVDTVTDNQDGTGTVVINGVTCDFVKAPLPPIDHSLVDNEDGTGTVTIDGVACTFVKDVHLGLAALTPTGAVASPGEQLVTIDSNGECVLTTQFSFVDNDGNPIPNPSGTPGERCVTPGTRVQRITGYDDVACAITTQDEATTKGLLLTAWNDIGHCNNDGSFNVGPNRVVAKMKYAETQLIDTSFTAGTTQPGDTGPVSTVQVTVPCLQLVQVSGQYQFNRQAGGSSLGQFDAIDWPWFWAGTVEFQVDGGAWMGLTGFDAGNGWKWDTDHTYAGKKTAVLTKGTHTISFRYRVLFKTYGDGMGGTIDPWADAGATDQMRVNQNSFCVQWPELSCCN